MAEMAWKKYAMIALVVLVVLFVITHMETAREFFAIDGLPA